MLTAWQRARSDSNDLAAQPASKVFWGAYPFDWTAELTGDDMSMVARIAFKTTMELLSGATRAPQFHATLLNLGGNVTTTLTASDSSAQPVNQAAVVDAALRAIKSRSSGNFCLRVLVHRSMGHYLRKARRHDGFGVDIHREPATNPEAGRIGGFPGGKSRGHSCPPLHRYRHKGSPKRPWPCGLPGMYTVEFVLAKPDARNAPENEFRFADQRRGDSHLAIASPR